MSLELLPGYTLLRTPTAFYQPESIPVYNRYTSAIFVPSSEAGPTYAPLEMVRGSNNAILLGVALGSADLFPSQPRRESLLTQRTAEPLDLANCS